ncbi:unnamed protein product [Phytophthora fragariaefolia]|uniref:Unnamed protein product n=1 Tax=Phytophthora fragariaefolia TaxID=1490495 RepID=A0A9W6U6H0_9STRA|nr:unnamed protein product [Phytophthora fragariaefolia]
MEDVPAVLVYMVYQRLKLAQGAHSAAGCGASSRANATAAPAAVQRHNGRVLELFQTLNRHAQIGALPRTRRGTRRSIDEAVSSVHLVSVKYKPPMKPLRTQEDQVATRMAADLNLQPQGEVLPAPATNGDVPVREEQQDAAAIVHNGAGAADDEDVYSVADGRERSTLTAWLATKRRVSERTLRSFLRQMLLAVDALERSNCEHADISPANIVVHSLPRMRKAESNHHTANATDSQPEGDDSDDDEDTDDDTLKGHALEAKVLQEGPLYSRRCTPFFQLFISRRNCQHIADTDGRDLDDVDADANLPDDIFENGGEFAEIPQQRQRLAGANAEAGNGNGIGGNGGHGGAVFRNRLALPHASMVSSVVQTAMTVWARGRFVDGSASTVLALLLRFPDSFPGGLREFLEYANYLVITHSAAASKLLRHDYLQCSGSELKHYPSLHWSLSPIHDVNEYKSKLVAFYGSLPSRVERRLDDNSSSSISSTVIDELMPRTTLGLQYFAKALDEANLPDERFVSVVAPSSASSSWVRRLASTQSCTLQRLDLSKARVPMSVVLRELATLPRLTHLRLPRQILRDENLEHLVAALAYSDLLPHLRGLDENVRQAMDRMEKSYLMQLDMVTFLLKKNTTSTAPESRAEA